MHRRSRFRPWRVPRLTWSEPDQLSSRHVCAPARSDMQKPPIFIGSGKIRYAKTANLHRIWQDPICKNRQSSSDLARSDMQKPPIFIGSGKIRYAKTANLHRIWQDPICKNRQSSSDLARSDMQKPPIFIGSGKIRYAKTANLHRIRTNYRIYFALSDLQNGFIGSFWYDIGSFGGKI